MAEKKSVEELGLTDEQLFTPEAMEFWKQFTPEEFLLIFFIEARSSFALLEGYLELLDKHVELESIKLDENLDAKQIYEILLKSTHRLKDAFDVMLDYQRHLKGQD